MSPTRVRAYLAFVCLAALLVPSGAVAASPDNDDLHLASVQAAIADMDADELLYRKHADRSVPIASLTKLMSAIVVLESGEPLDEWLTIVERRERAPNNAYTRMRVGSKLQRGTLLRLALMASANHAIYVIARHHPGGLDGFVAAMNRHADRLGMTRSHFVDPSGLSVLNHASAADVLKMIRAAMEHAKVRSYTQTERYVARFRHPRYDLYFGNTNILVFRDHWHVALSKTGYLDEAGRCLALVTELDGRTVAMALLDSFGTRSPVGDAGRIKRWLTTGASGRVAASARRYETRRNRAFARRTGPPQAHGAAPVRQGSMARADEASAPGHAPLSLHPP